MSYLLILNLDFWTSNKKFQVEIEVLTQTIEKIRIKCIFLTKNINQSFWLNPQEPIWAVVNIHNIEENQKEEKKANGKRTKHSDGAWLKRLKNSYMTETVIVEILSKVKKDLINMDCKSGVNIWFLILKENKCEEFDTA